MLTRRDFLKRVGAVGAAAALGTRQALAQLRSSEKENAMATIQTVTGPIAPAELGMTLIHEHVMCDFIGAEETGAHGWDQDEVFEVMLPYLTALRKAGGQTFVDCSPKFLGRDPILLRRLAQASGLYIITNTGLYKAPYLPKYALEGTAESLADDWTREAEQGIDDTGIRPGFIKIAANEGDLNPIQQKIVRAAALTHLRTGLTIAAHTTEARTLLQELDVLQAEGVAASAFIWVHADAQANRDIWREAGRRGAWIELDAVNPEVPERHIEMIKDLIEAGLIDQVLISQDRGWYNVGDPRGGDKRPYDKLLTDFVSAMKKAGIDNATIDKLLKANPRRALEPKVLVKRS
jgi:phosphotriesterase-related protein